jgi:hypothetical protein
MPVRFKMSYGSTPVGQFSIPGTGPDLGGALQRAADAPIKPSKAQEPCDIGLFSDSSSQLDLVTLANQARKS